MKKRRSFLIFFLCVLFFICGGSLYYVLQRISANAMENPVIRLDRTAGQEEGHVCPFGSESGKECKTFRDGKPGKKTGIRKKCLRIYKKNEELLVLVNRQQELPEDDIPNLMTICNGRLQASPLLYSALKEMLADAGNAGCQYWIASAYRSRERQQQLVNEDIQALVNQGMDYESAAEETYKETQPAGHSEHETGLALDILCSENPYMTMEQENQEGNKWLRENSWKYGFVLRYPREKEDITGIRYEPWHFRYVGKRAAKFMYLHDLVLEEFYQSMEG